MQSRQFAIADLEWLCQQSCADCGISSAQGYFLDVAKLGHWIHSGHSQLLLEQERVVGAIARRKALCDRMRRLSSEEQWTLALAFASPVKLPGKDGVAVTLLGDTNAAKTALQQMRLAPPKHTRKLVKGLACTRPGLPNRFETYNAREFVAWLWATSATQKKNHALFDTIIDEARTRLSAAVDAFCATGEDGVDNV